MNVNGLWLESEDDCEGLERENGLILTFRQQVITAVVTYRPLLVTQPRHRLVTQGHPLKAMLQ